MGEVHVRVAVRIRPLLPKEILHNHQVCVRVVPDSAQVMLGTDRDFSFDHAFGPAVSQDAFYESCVQPLVRSLVEGYNATVFAYGQTGSGKTYTLHDEEGMGIVGRVAYDVFTGLKGEQATVTMSYMELYREELRDLLELHTHHKELHIREDDRGNTVVAGLKEMLVSSVEELLSILDTGNALRHTGTTRMNERSSRSHTILTLQVTKHCHGSVPSSSNTVCLSKLHLVDLAGSERASKTGNTGVRLKESAHINTDLLALGNVIRALTDPGRNRRESHVPFRDAKITRLLRDSLGGSAHTLMVACVSPSHHSVAETLSVLRFASRARHVRNRPGKTCAITWDPGVARRGELEQEVQTLREALKDKGRELDAVSRGKEGELHSQQAGQMDGELDPEEAQAQHITIVQLRRELNKCQEALAIDEQVFVQKEDELRQLQKEMRKLLQESKIHLQAFEQEKERTRIQTEQMVEQQILIDRLRDNLMTSKVTSLEEGVSGKLAKRPHSVPLLRHSCGQRPARNIHTSPPAYSLERVMAAFKMRGQLLLAEVEEKDEVYCPFITQQEKLSHRDQGGEEEVNEEGGMGFRRSLNRTWTSRQNPSQKQNNTLLEQRSQNQINLPQQPQSATATEEISADSSSLRETSIIQRRIQELSINMRMKEELMKELDKTGQEAEAAERRGSRQAAGGALARLSLQSQQARAELHRSLQHMKLQRLQLQHSLRQQSEQVRDTTVGPLPDDRSTELAVEDLTVCQSLTEDSEGKEQQSVWLEEEEELALQRRAELQELEDELRSREEVLQHRDHCLQQRHTLEIKRLRSSQALSRDKSLLSDELHSLEKQLEGSSNARQAVGVTAAELEKERDALIRRRDALDRQLRDGRLLTAQEEHSLLQLEEAVEALDTALEFKNRSIVNRQKQLSITCQSHSTEPAQLCDVIMKLRALSLPEASELLVQYFNKVVHLREEERHLRLRCEELQLQAWEQDKVLREMEAALQRVALETDRRLTQQHREHQGTVQLLLQQVTEGRSEGKDEGLLARIQQLEKELFFYKSSSRQLKKKVRELLNDPQLSLPLPATQSSLQQTRPESSHTDALNMQVYTRTSGQHTPAERRKTHKLQAKMSQALADAGQTHTQRHKHRTSSCPSSSSELQTHRKSKVLLTHASVHTHTQPEERNGGGHSGEGLKMMPVCLPRRELRQISLADPQVGVNATGGCHSAAKTTIDSNSILEDSIEMSRNMDC